MGDACSRCGGHGKIKDDSRSDPSRPCWACNGTGMTLPAPRRPADRR